jgi:phenylpropionate dioxygenase-like ring-hydroxylating dioxygenase large terminal subunit
MNAIPGKPEVEAVEPIPAKVYISREWAQAEKERLWPRVWQMACREEEIPSAGDFYTYEIADESITVVRRADNSIGAYFNVCPHRGRRLTEGCGKMGKFHCRFHGWQFDLHGKPIEVVDRQDWGDTLKDEEITLQSVQVASWGGWVFINMDPKAEPFEAFLGPAKPILDPFQFDKMRFVWRKQIKLECNWKVILEAFNEGYHVQTTHKQLVPLYNDLTYSKAYGKHGMFGATADGLFGLPSPRLGPPQGDIRKGLAAFNAEIYSTLRACSTLQMVRAGERLVKELPETATPMEVFTAFNQFHKEEAEKDGLPWPEMTQEEIMAGGTDWHIFPNMVFLPSPTGALCYRSRPRGDDPDHCTFEVYVLERYAEGKEPKVEVEYADSWRDVDWGLILSQDFANVEEIQKGLKSRSFRGARPNPYQEVASINFHRVLQEYVEGQG